MNWIDRTAAEHWICLLAMIGLGAAMVKLRRMARLQTVERVRERRLREELEAYAQLDSAQVHEGVSDPATEAKALAKRVCRTIADKSAFTRVAMMMRDAEGRLYCAGTAGVDDLTVQALHAWGEETQKDEQSQGLRMARAKGRSFSIQLGEWAKFDREVGSWAMAGNKERRRWRRGIIAPIRLSNGRMVGAIAVCADGSRGSREPNLRFEAGMSPIESLASRIAISMENEMLAERVLRAEKLAALGQLAGGVAHALNNPLTAVLGFAELIAESSHEDRVRRDAETIRTEALKMRDTVQQLTEFWRPAAMADEAVDVVALLEDLGLACQTRLEDRGVELILTPTDGVPIVRGSADRLKQVMEHLLNNSAQSIAEAGPREEGHAIRVTVTHDEATVNVIVSDSGTGFAEPGKIFDPFYTTRQPGEGSGLGLSLCFGIVREHGGEISAFNLHPHGAAVVIELPVRRAVRAESSAAIRAVKVA